MLSPFYFFKTTKTARNSARGFTLVEMMISVAIIGVISSVIVYNHNKFDSDLEINNAAYRLALSIREAQVYGISAREVTTAQDPTDRFSLSYGVHLNDPTKLMQKNRYIFFVDADNSSQKYSSTAEDHTCTSPECIEQTIMGKGITVSGFYGLTDETWYNLSEEDPELYAMDILFKRPNPDAVFNFYSEDYDDNPLNNICNGAKCDGVAVCLLSPQGREKRVVVFSTGQISVENVGFGEAGVSEPCVEN